MQRSFLVCDLFGLISLKAMFFVFVIRDLEIHSQCWRSGSVIACMCPLMCYSTAFGRHQRHMFWNTLYNIYDAIMHFVFFSFPNMYMKVTCVAIHKSEKFSSAHIPPRPPFENNFRPELFGSVFQQNKFDETGKSRKGCCWRGTKWWIDGSPTPSQCARYWGG